MADRFSIVLRIGQGLLLMLFTIKLMALPSSNNLYATEIEAVKAATDLYNPSSISQDREFMGTIYRSGHHFGYTVNAGEIGANRISISVPAAQWPSVVAIWHTHGDASPLHRFFSRPDTKLVEETGLPLYLADYTGTLKVYRPEHRPLSGMLAERYGLPRRRGYSLGEVVRNEGNEDVLVSTGSGNSEITFC